MNAGFPRVQAWDKRTIVQGNSAAREHKRAEEIKVSERRETIETKL